MEIDFEPPMTTETAHLLLRRFLSSLAWAEGFAIRETFSLSGGRRVGFGRSQPGMVLNRHFQADYLPDPADPKAQLALALYREALGLDNCSYQFLGFFKIINVLCSTGKKQRDWIKGALPNIADHQAKERLQELQKTLTDVATYLYKSGRCAVAHAFNKPVVDPDNIEDYHRLSSDLPVIKALAEYLIEREFGVKSQSTIWREHLYELDGFRRILGSSVVAVLKAGGKPKPEEIPPFPNLSVCLRDHGPFPSFEDLKPETVEAHAGILVLILRAVNCPVRLALTLHVAEEHLGFDPTTDIEIQDDGSTRLVAAAIDRARLISGMVANGQLEVWQTQPKQLLGRCDPCIPVNIDPRRTNESLRKLISELEQELARRKGEA